MYPDLVKVKHGYLGNLKSLKVKIKPLKYELLSSMFAAKLKYVGSTIRYFELIKSFKARFESGSLIPDGILNYLIQNSPLAEVEIIDCCQTCSRTS
jgi:hypothetical protein